MKLAPARYTTVTLRTAQDTLAEDVRRGLTTPAKWLHCKYFYDSAGSALFVAGGFTSAFAGQAGTVGAALLEARITRAAVALAASDPAFKELVSERISSLTEGAVRAMIGPTIKLMVDYNQSLDPVEACRRIARLADFDIYWVEEPVKAEDLAADESGMDRPAGSPRP